MNCSSPFEATVAGIDVINKSKQDLDFPENRSRPSENAKVGTISIPHSELGPRRNPTSGSFVNYQLFYAKPLVRKQETTEREDFLPYLLEFKS